MSGRHRKKQRARETQKNSEAPRLGSLSRVIVVACLALASAAGYWLFHSWSPEGAPLRRSFNLVLISIDTLRADSLSCYGSGTVATPHIDRLAAEGVLFEQVVTSAPTTLPAHASLFTGVTPLRHLVHDNVGFHLPEEIPTLASLLRNAGYRTGGFVGAFVMDSRFGIGRGFDTYFDRFATTRGEYALERRGEAVLRPALSWLEESRAEPFFAFLHFYDPHRPYNPPPPFFPQQTSNRALYEGEVAYVDSLVGRLLDRIDEHGLSDNTIVVLTSDHGESLGEHGEDTHGFFLYESTLRIPLLIRYPGGKQGRRIREMVRIIDIAPTLLDWLGVEMPPDLEGTSLRPLLERNEKTNSSAYAETLVPRLHYGWSELRSLRRGSHKFILAPRSELYDLEADPEESRNLMASRPDIAERMKEELEGILGEDESRIPRPAELDERSLRSLQALGYVGEPERVDAVRSYLELEDPKDRLGLYTKILDLAVQSDIKLENEENYKRALETFRSILKEDAKNLRAHILYGNLLQEAGRAREAAIVYGNLLDLQPDSLSGTRGLARAQMALGRTGEAKKNLQRAIEIDPNSVTSYRLLAELARKEGDLEAAEGWLRKALAVDPDRSIYQELADVLVASGRSSEAEDLLSGVALEDDGTSAVAAYMRGEHLFARGDIEGALPHFRRASQLSPEDDDIQQAIGNALAASGDLEGARATYVGIVERSPCYAGAHVNLGVIYERWTRLDDAVDAYQKAIACDGSYAQAYRNLASVLFRQGHAERAMEAIRSALRLRPDDLELKKIFQEMQRRQGAQP